MSDKLKESLSAVVDGEADEFELRRVLDEVGKDVELRETWDRYHLINGVIRNDRPLLTGSDRMRANVWAATQADVSDHTPDVAFVNMEATASEPAEKSGNWLGRGLGVAVAAGVAFAIVFTTTLNQPDGQQSPDLASVEVASPLAIENPVDRPLGLEISPSDLRRSNAYMMHHVQQKALNNADVLSLVKMVTYEPTE
jgi:sigma-E factor negative regulatory protein RseA